MSSKYASEYPLPGWVDQYFNSLVTLLKRVSDTPPEQQQLVEFVFQKYPRTRGSTAVGQYLAHITRSGLWVIKDGKYRLTPGGSSVAEKVEAGSGAGRRMLMQMKFRTIAGYEEMFRFLSEDSRAFDEIDSALKAALQAQWKSKNQTAFRLSWLRSLGYADKQGHSYGLTPAGHAVLDSLPSAKKKNDEGEVKPPRDENLHPLVQTAVQLADTVDKAALSGQDGPELEQQACHAFAFLGFDAQVIGDRWSGESRCRRWCSNGVQYLSCTD